MFIHAGQRALHRGTHAVLVDETHVEHLDAGGVHQALLAGIHAADADLAQLARTQRRPLRREAADAHQLGRAVAAQAGHRHAVDVAAGRERDGVEVGVRVEPQHAQRPAAGLAMPRHGADGADGQAVVATQQHRQLARLQRAEHGVVHGAVPCGHLGQMAKAVHRRQAGVGRAAQVAGIQHVDALAAQRLHQTGHAQRLGPHAGAARAAADVGGGADEGQGGCIAHGESNMTNSRMGTLPMGTPRLFNHAANS